MNNIYKYVQKIHFNLMKYGSFCPNIGLLDGKMGIAIFLYEYACKYNDSESRLYADEIVKDIIEESTEELSISISSGLTGLALGMQYLVDGGHLRFNNNSFLSDIDSSIMKISDNQYFGEEDYFIGLYYIYRLKELKNSKLCRDKIEYLNKSLENDMVKLLLKEEFNTPQIISILFYFVFCIQNNIDIHRIRNIINQISEQIINILSGCNIFNGNSLLLYNIILFFKQSGYLTIAEDVFFPNTAILYLNDMKNYFSYNILFSGEIFSNYACYFMNDYIKGLIDQPILDQFLSTLTLHNLGLQYYPTGVAYYFFKKILV